MMARAQILVAERDPGFAGGLAANLESLGYAVTEVVSSPEAALKKAEENRPDLSPVARPRPPPSRSRWTMDS